MTSKARRMGWLRGRFLEIVPGEWRTRVVKGRCVMWKENSCSIYDTPEYPAVCRGFPFIDAESGGAYEFDQTICPEFLARPELIQLGSTRRNGAR